MDVKDMLLLAIAVVIMGIVLWMIIEMSNNNMKFTEMMLMIQRALMGNMPSQVIEATG
jgi:hypothetical protein